MKFWTIMVIIYGTSVFEKDQSMIPYPSAEACGAAIEPIWDSFDAAFPDMVIQCVPTELPSRMIRPKARPAHLEGAW